MLRLNVALQEDLDEELATLRLDISVLRLDSDRPEGLQTQQILEMDMVDDLEASRLRDLVNVTMLGIDMQEQHFEALKAFDAKASAVQLRIVAHDFLEDVSAASLV